ncbi:MAG: Butyrate kinase 2 [Firmicutes bacterium ADurb.Bin153]|nr:MAG: Butyrate kinase 2 [Firmicutes bacterium ADurb.Bin153]
MGSVSTGSITIIAVNPGSTSTKLAVFKDGAPVKSMSIEHDKVELDSMGQIKDQLKYRIDAVEAALAGEAETLDGISAVVGRGGLLKPMEGGVWEVDERMVEDALDRPVSQHASNLGCAIALHLAKKAGVPAYIVDPVCTDEYEPEARVSGLPQIPRISLLHTLSARSSARRAAGELGLDLGKARFVIAHMGGGTTICALRDGRLVDANNSNDEGPFTPERTGTMPSGAIVDLCYSGKYSKAEVRDMFLRKAGLFAYVGTSDAREVDRRIDAGDQKALEVMQAMAYQIAKEIGAYAAVLSFRLDAVILTGGLAKWPRLLDEITRRIGFLGRIMLYPGENEMQALGDGATLAVKGIVPVKRY